MHLTIRFRIILKTWFYYGCFAHTSLFLNKKVSASDTHDSHNGAVSLFVDVELVSVIK